jgi:undecaprenyl-diphosphatase
MGATVLFGAIMVLSWAALHGVWRVAAIGLAGVVVAAVAASRVLLGVHFVSDVIAGVLVGVGWVAIAAIAFPPWGAHRPADVPAPAQRRSAESMPPRV